MPPKKYKSKKQLKKEGLMGKDSYIAPSYSKATPSMKFKQIVSKMKTFIEKPISSKQKKIKPKNMETLGSRIMKEFKSPMKSAGLDYLVHSGFTPTKMGDIGIPILSTKTSPRPSTPSFSKEEFSQPQQSSNPYSLSRKQSKKRKKVIKKKKR